jgi:Aminoglycoside-2''-adenylyltransferase
MRWDGPPLDAWAPWRPEEVARRLAGVRAPWCVVGGWAIDLFLGQETRPHEDVEIAVPRRDFSEIRAQLAGFALHVVGDGEVRALAPGEVPPAERHQTWVLDPSANAWRLDVMLEPGDAATWVFRRDESIRRPRQHMLGVSRVGIPYLRPEGALLYKAKATREKDEADFAAALPRLEPSGRAWLRGALERMHPQHAWISALK